MRPARHLALEHGEREHEASARGELQHAGIAGGFVARDDEGSDLALGGYLARLARDLPPRGGHPAAVRRAREQVDGHVGLRRERGRERADVPASGRVVLGPDERDAPGAAQGLGGLAQVLGHVLAAERRAHLSGGAGRGLHGSSGVHGDHLCAGPSGRSQPEVDDGRPLDDGIVADDEAGVGVADSGKRRAEGVEPGLEVVGKKRDTATRRLRDARKGGCLLHSLCTGEGDDERAARLLEAARGRLGRLLVGDGVEAAAPHAQERLVDAVGGAQMLVPEAPLVAEPAFVDLRVVAGEDSCHRAFPRRRPDVAADRAETADRGDVLDLPGPRAEAVSRRREGADGAELDHVPGEMGAVGLVLERGDDRLRAPVHGDELAVLRHVLGKARAAVAENAALAVEGDEGRDRDGLVERPLGEVHARVSRAEAEGEVLERALAALVAVGAVERVVEKDELEHRVLALGRPLARRRRPEHHPVLRGQRASRLELRHALDLAEAHPAGAERRPNARLVAEDRDLDADRERRLDEPRTLGRPHLAAVDGDANELGLRLCAHGPLPGP